MSVIQIILCVFVLFAFTRTLRQFRRGRLSIALTILWAFLWVLVGVGVTLPQTTDLFARLVGVGRGVDAIMYISILVLFYSVFRLYVRLEESERELTKLVRSLALRDIDSDSL